MKRREMKLLLEERFERIALLETRIDTLDQLVEGYRAREQSIFNTLQAAKENAAKTLEQAKAEGATIIAAADAARADAENIRAASRAEAESLLEQAISTANTLKQEAERRGNEMTAEIKADSERMFRDAEIIKREYEELVESFNAMLEQNASELEVTAARFAEFVKNRKIDRSEARLDGDAFYKSVSEMNDTSLPDASENPALLMQNIYRIQNRPMPGDRQEQPEQAEVLSAASKPESEATNPQETIAQRDDSSETKAVFSMEVDSGSNENLSGDRPFSEAVWLNETQKSESEPQAEFARVFDPDYAKSDYNVHGEPCSVTKEDAKSVFDELISGQETDSAVISIPFSSAAVAAGLDEKPLEDAVRAFDEYFDASIEPSGKTAQDEVSQEKAEGPEGAASEPAAIIPEPYSEQAWAQSSIVSNFEPQAEGSLFGDVNALTAEPIEAIAAEKEIPAVAAPESETVTAMDVEDALDDYINQIGAITSAAPDAPAIAPESFSEKSWMETDLPGSHESQAEGVHFDAANIYLPEYVHASDKAAGQYMPTTHGIFIASAPVSAKEAERAFDVYLKQIDNGESTAAEPAPYSKQAWAQSDHASDHEPQAEGALFTDVNAFEPTFTPAAGAPENYVRTFKPAERASGPVTASDAVNVFDDYLAQLEPFAPTLPETAATEPASTPEPYSALAWAYTPNVSEYEPQAEGESIISIYDPDKKEDRQAYEHISYSEPAVSAEPEEEEEPEPAPAPRRYNEYGEIREWEPEPEPDMSDVPTVSRYMGQSGGSDDISLDDLLDEIIKAGE
ncbi:MAG: hypothetical protein C0413_01135 [Clostridiales bacterium]|nr:hypothetical protein [Clostridiales bacterium]